MFVFLMRLFVLHFCLGPFAVICRDCLWHRKNVLSTKLHDFRIGRGSTSHHARVEFRERSCSHALQPRHRHFRCLHAAADVAVRLVAFEQPVRRQDCT